MRIGLKISFEHEREGPNINGRKASVENDKVTAVVVLDVPAKDATKVIEVGKDVVELGEVSNG